MPRPVCLPCMKFFRPLKNGVVIEEGRPIQNNGGPPVWGPYKLWHADLWHCPSCQTQIVTGYATKPLAEHFEPTYASDPAHAESLGRVDDC